MPRLAPVPAQSRPLPRPDWLPATEWPLESRLLPLDGHHLHYVDAGAGSTLLFVHAGFWSFVWRDAIVRLRDRFHCLALDFPGSGLSEAAPDYEISLANHGRVLEAFVDALGLEEVTLVVHDLGSVVGLSLAARRPRLVRAIVAVNTFGWPPDDGRLRSMLGLMGSAPMRAVGTATNLLARATASGVGVGRRLSPAGRRAFLGPCDDPARRGVNYRLLGDVLRSTALLADVERALATTLRDRPLLTIFGERNDPLGFQPRWKALVPAARQVVVPAGNHFPMNDDPDLFARSLAEWWDQAVAPAPPPVVEGHAGAAA